jgi:nucleotide-binding universal stress UspA family protein
MFSRILVPTDGSAASNVALPLARTVAKATGAPVTLMRVLELEDGTPSREAFAQAQNTLRHIAAELRESVSDVDAVVEGADNVAEAIIRQTRRQHADLVIMRTHGRGGLERAVLGSVTQRVLAHSDVPLLLLRAGGRRITQIRTLLVPIDGSPGGTLALGMAVQLARKTGATIKVLQVMAPVPQWVYAGDPYDGIAYYDPMWDEEALTSAKQYMDNVVSRLRAANMTADGDVRQDPDVAPTIIAAAESANADLIIMSTRALTGPARAVMGSTADAVVRGAHCPVLLTHRARVSEAATLEFELEAATAPV